jgi:hypothetical protein
MCRFLVDIDCPACMTLGYPFGCVVTGAISDGRQAAVDRQLHSIHEARIV